MAKVDNYLNEIFLTKRELEQIMNGKTRRIYLQLDELPFGVSLSISLDNSYEDKHKGKTNE